MLILATSAEAVSASADVVTASVAVIAGAFAGYQILLAARDRRQRDRPFVVVDLAEGSRGYTNTVELVVANAGLTVARDVTLSFITLPTAGDDRWPSLPDQIGDGIPALAPGREHRFVARYIIRTMGGTRLSTEGSARVVVGCRDDKNREYRDKYELTSTSSDVASQSPTTACGISLGTSRRSSERCPGSTHGGASRTDRASDPVAGRGGRVKDVLAAPREGSGARFRRSPQSRRRDSNSEPPDYKIQNGGVGGMWLMLLPT